MDLNDDVGFVSITATIVLIPNYIFVIDGAYGNESSGSIVFNDGSQIVFAGYYVAANLFTAGTYVLAFCIYYTHTKKKKK
jgi:Mg2+ and Co2+ transporter CorA